jgi:hypothetical protein
VPLIVANAGGGAPEPGTYTHNLHLTRGLALGGQASRSRRGNGGNSS